MSLTSSSSSSLSVADNDIFLMVDNMSNRSPFQTTQAIEEFLIHSFNLKSPVNDQQEEEEKEIATQITPICTTNHHPDTAPLEPTSLDSGQFVQSFGGDDLVGDQSFLEESNDKLSLDNTSDPIFNGTLPNQEDGSNAQQQVNTPQFADIVPLSLTPGCSPISPPQTLPSTPERCPINASIYHAYRHYQKNIMTSKHSPYNKYVSQNPKLPSSPSLSSPSPSPSPSPSSPYPLLSPIPTVPTSSPSLLLPPSPLPFSPLYSLVPTLPSQFINSRGDNHTLVQPTILANQVIIQHQPEPATLDIQLSKSLKNQSFRSGDIIQAKVSFKTNYSMLNTQNLSVVVMETDNQISITNNEKTLHHQLSNCYFNLCLGNSSRSPVSGCFSFSLKARIYDHQAQAFISGIEASSQVLNYHTIGRSKSFHDQPPPPPPVIADKVWSHQSKDTKYILAFDQGVNVHTVSISGIPTTKYLKTISNPPPPDERQIRSLWLTPGSMSPSKDDLCEVKAYELPTTRLEVCVSNNLQSKSHTITVLYGYLDGGGQQIVINNEDILEFK